MIVMVKVIYSLSLDLDLSIKGGQCKKRGSSDWVCKFIVY